MENACSKLQNKNTGIDFTVLKDKLRRNKEIKRPNSEY